MNFSSTSRGSLSVEMCDNLYFTNRKVGVLHAIQSTQSEWRLYILERNIWASKNINVCDVAKRVAGEFHLLGLRQLPRLPRLVSLFNFNNTLLSALSFLLLWRRSERVLPVWSGHFLCFLWHCCWSDCVWWEQQTPLAASVYSLLPSSATPTQVVFNQNLHTYLTYSQEATILYYY